jgi:hypothetical protein
MVCKFGFDVNAIEENTGLNPLAMAIKRADINFARLLVIFYAFTRVQ